MQNIAQLMGGYEKYHTKTFTKLTHFVGVPIIYFSVAMVFSWLNFPIGSTHHISLSWIAMILLMAYYFYLDFILGLFSTIASVIIIYLAQRAAGPHYNYNIMVIFWILFIAGWIAQFIGHYVEGKRPAFIDNTLQIFVAPIFLVGELLFWCGFKKDLEQKIKQESGELL